MRDLMTYPDQKTVTAEVVSVHTVDAKNGAGELVRIHTRDGNWYQGFYEVWKDFDINEVLVGDTFEITYRERAGSKPGLVFRNFTKVRNISEEERVRGSKPGLNTRPGATEAEEDDPLPF